MTNKIVLDMVQGLTTALGGKAPTGDIVALTAAIAALPPVTPWVAYTPTIVGVGTPTNVQFLSRRVGGNLEVMGRYTSGTPTGVNMSVSLGFNGINGGLAVSNALALLQLVGVFSYSASSASFGNVLAQATNSVVNFGIQTASTGGLILATGSALNTASNVMSMKFSVPIQGW